MKLSLVHSQVYYQNMKEIHRQLSMNRQGYLSITLRLPYDDHEVEVMLDRNTLYVIGFYSSTTGKWYRFKGDLFPDEVASVELPIDGSYQTLGGLQFTITQASIQDIRYLNKYDGGRITKHLKVALRTIIVSLSEALRFADIITWMMAVLALGQSFDVWKQEDQLLNWKVGTRRGKLGILLPHTNP